MAVPGPAFLRRMEARRNPHVTGLWLGFLAAGLTLLLWWGGLFVQARLALEDAFVIPRPVSGDVVMVAIDDTSLARYGRFTDWPRTRYADLIARLAADGARVVALDVLLAESTEDDAALAEAIAAARQSAARTRVVLAAIGVQRDTSRPDGIAYRQMIDPLPLFSEVGAMAGNVSVLPDVDGRIRHVPLLIVQEVGDTLQPSFALAAFLNHRGVSATLMKQVIESVPGALTLPGGQVVPTDSAGQMRITYYSVPGVPQFPVYSFVDVLEGTVPDGVFADKIVVVGLMEQTALTDSFSVPGSRDGTLMAGVEIHANALETLLQGTPLREQSQALQVMTIIALAILGGVVFFALPGQLLLPGVVVALLTWVGAVALIYNLQGVVINLFHSGLALLLAAFVVVIYRVLGEIMRRQRTEILLSSALSAIDQKFSLNGILAGLAEDLGRILGSRDVRCWLWNTPRGELDLAYPEPPRGGEALPLEAQNWLELATAALTARTELGNWLHQEQRRVALPLVWQEQRVGVLTGSISGRLGPFRRDLLRRFSWQTAELIVSAELYEETRRLSDFKTRMIRMASHDLKNPLSRVMIYAEMMTDENQAPLPEERMRSYANQILRASDVMNRIISDLLDLEYVRKGLQAVHEYDLLQIVDEVVMRFEADITHRQQTLTVETPETLRRLNGDVIQIRQAIGNLLSNATKYTPDGGQITLRIQDRGDRVLLQVQDTGYGIPAEAISHLFQEFYRAKTEATQDISGTGLGLSLVKAVVDAHGGKIWVESALGMGSTFSMELPYRLPESLRPVEPPPA